MINWLDNSNALKNCKICNKQIAPSLDGTTYHCPNCLVSYKKEEFDITEISHEHAVEIGQIRRWKDCGTIIKIEEDKRNGGFRCRYGKHQNDYHLTKNLLENTDLIIIDNIYENECDILEDVFMDGATPLGTFTQEDLDNARKEGYSDGYAEALNNVMGIFK